MSNRKTVPVCVERQEGPGGQETVEQHPSFGVVQIGRYTCTPAQNFFGSSVKHHAGVTLSISTASKRHSLGRDWYFGEQEIVEINMTAAQWSELLCNFNVGEGVPCTLTRVYQCKELSDQYPKPIVPPCPEVTLRQQFEEDFKKTMTRLASQISSLVDAAKKLQEKPSINKADRQSFADIAESIKCQVENNLPFIQGQFNEALDKTLVDAKASLESFLAQATQSVGGEEMRKKLGSTLQILDVDNSKSCPPVES